jgi:nitrate reductase NapAB chaperone NapD
MNYEQLINNRLNSPHGQLIVFFGQKECGKSFAAKHFFPHIDFLLDDDSVQLSFGSKVSLDLSEVTNNHEHGKLIIVDEAQSVTDDSLIQLLSLVNNQKKVLLIMQSLQDVVDVGNESSPSSKLLEAFSPHLETTLFVEFLGPIDAINPEIVSLEELKVRKHL